MKKSELRQMIREEIVKELAIPQEHSGALAKDIFKSLQKHPEIEKSDLLKVITNQMAGLLLTAQSTGNFNKLSNGLKSLFTKI